MTVLLGSHGYSHTYIQLYLNTENHQFNYITKKIFENIKTVLPDCRTGVKLFSYQYRYKMYPNHF